jgi:hypothetical protein
VGGGEKQEYLVIPITSCYGTLFAQFLKGGNTSRPIAVKRLADSVLAVRHIPRVPNQLETYVIEGVRSSQ